MWAGIITAVARLLSALSSYAGIAIAWFAGKRSAKNDALEKGVDLAREAAEIDENVGRLSDSERRRWLFGDPPD